MREGIDFFRINLGRNAKPPQETWEPRSLEENLRPYEINTHGHVWRRDSDGSLDIFGYDWDNHNGPICVVCGYGFCHHCQEEPGVECPGPEGEMEEAWKRDYEDAMAYLDKFLKGESE